MIKIVSAVPCSPARATVDPWVPLTIEWNIPLNGGALYLFARDPDDGYVEFKLDPDSGALVGMTVIDSPRETTRAIVRSTDTSVSESPVVDLEFWPRTETPDYTEPKTNDFDLEVTLSQTATDGAIAVWFSDQPVARLVVSGDVSVGVAATGELVVVTAFVEGVLQPNGQQHQGVSERPVQPTGAACGPQKDRKQPI